MKSFKSSLSTFLLLAVCAVTSGCTKEKLQKLDQLYLETRGYARVEADFCMQSPTAYRQRLKYIFVLDKSSSNQDVPFASDPTGAKRYSPLFNFLQNAQDDPGYTYYSLINFSDNATLVQGFTDSRTGFQQVVKSEWDALGPRHPSDQGFTDYLAALSAITHLIQTDVDAAKNSTDATPLTAAYMVIFISDGYPLVADPSTPSGMLNQAYNPDIKNRIEALLALKANLNYKAYIDQIILDTGYYFESGMFDQNAQNLLAQMASQAKGLTYQFGSGRSIDYTLFALPIRNVRYLLSDVFVENASTTWWNGKLMRDTDGDGIPDEIEVQMGSNPYLADSDGNGVSDFVEYRTKGKPCKDGGCSRLITLRDNYAACSGLMPPLTPDGQINPTPDGVNASPRGTVYFNDRDHDGLNDCEEMILRSDRDNFDSNSDLIPDFLSFKYGLPFIAGTNAASGDSDSDGISNYEEIKLGTPIFTQNSKLIDFLPPKYNLAKKDPVDGQDCYHLTVDQVATAGWDNKIRIWLIENTAVVDDKPILKKVEKVLNGKEKSVYFSQGDFF